MRKIENFIYSLFGWNQDGNYHPSRGKILPPDQARPVQRIKPLFPKLVSQNVVKTKLYALSESPIWDWECFRSILICLATMGEGSYIPASRRPNCVYLNGLQTTIMELRQISVQRQGRETSRVVFVDRERSCLTISGKTRIGTTHSVKIDMTPKSGRGRMQIPVLTIHVHPGQAGSVGLSDLDYVSFLSDQNQIIMMICYPGGILFAMKTSVPLEGDRPGCGPAPSLHDQERYFQNLYLGPAKYDPCL